MRTMTLTFPFLMMACAPGLGELDEQRLQWEQAGGEDYRITVQEGCFCPDTRPIEVTVVGGAVTAATRQQASDQPAEAVDPADFQPWFTVDGLFTEAERALDEADEVDVAYDEELGHPTAIDVDWLTNAMDDEWSVSVLSLTLDPVETQTPVR